MAVPKELLATMVRRIELQSDRVNIELDRLALVSRLLGRMSDQTTEAATATLSAPIAFKRRGVEAKLLMCTGDSPEPLPNKLLIETLTNAHRWFRSLTDGTYRSIRELADCEQVHPAEISRVLPLVFLAPEVTEAILPGRHSVDLTSRELKRLTDLPDDWADQRRLFG